MVAGGEEQRQGAVAAAEREGEEAASGYEGLQEPTAEDKGGLGLL